MTATTARHGRRGARPSKPKVVRNRINQWAGLLACVGLLVLAIPVVDSMHLWSVFYDARDETWLQALPWYLGFMLMGMGFLVLGARPRVEVDDDQLVIRNILRDVYVPRGNVLKVDDESGTYLRVVSTHGRYRCWGCERFNYEVFSDRPGPGGRRLHDIAVTPSGAAPDVVAWRKPEWYELAFLVVWLAYPVAALIA